MELIPLFDKVFVKTSLDDEVSEGGLFLPTPDKTALQKGVVMAVGEGKVSKDGVLISTKVKVGDTVLFMEHMAAETKIGGEKYFFMKETDIVAKIEE